MPCLGSSIANAVVGDVQVRHMRATVPADEVHEHEHDEAHLVLVLDGCYLSDAADMPGECSAPALVFNPPSTRHRDRFAAVGGRFLSVSLPREAWLGHCPAASTYTRARRLDIDALALAASLAALLNAPDTAARLDLEGQVHALLQLAARTNRDTSGRRPRWLAAAKERLATDETSFSLGEVARDCGVDPAQLSRAFRKFEHCTPGQFVRRRRLQRVLGQWSRDELGSLTDAAVQAGFFDHAHLVRAMRQEAGVTPSQLRTWLRTARRRAG